MKKTSRRYNAIKLEATDKYGKCPKCNSKKSKIFRGLPGIYFSMICPNGHDWIYTFYKRVCGEYLKKRPPIRRKKDKEI